MYPDYFHPFPSHADMLTPEQMAAVYRDMMKLFSEKGPDSGLLIENAAEMEALLAAGKPLFSRLSDATEFTGFEEIFETLSQLIAHHSTPAPDPFTLVSQLVSGREEYWEELSSWWGIEPALSAVLGTLSAKPYLMVTGRELKGKVDLSQWQRPRCPVCFSFPSMAAIDEKQGRLLYCSLCETEWPFARPGCSFCGSLEAARVIRPRPDDAGLWLDLCDGCDRYLKTTDLTHQGPALTPATDLETFDLDVTAQEQNYQREALNPVGIREAVD